MGKIINLSAVLEKEEKLQQVVDYMEELKDQFSDLSRSMRMMAHM